MPTDIQDIVYRDLDLQFLPHPNTGDVVMLKNHKAIMRSVRNLVFMNMYDSPYNPSIYGGILAALFENFDPILVKQLKNRLETLIRNHEKRAIYLDTIVSSDESLDRNAIDLKIFVRPINDKSPIEISITLERIR